ncbi:hypothetical protein TSUD_231740 [Trifolium subterraneum]|uniref:Uncharacterized protein n=1 Tax=Trifolium subterraneum TaxID=3900 RepID=A0A2Z6LPP2_TRISU|nr:hypothetical protein TSUD_231740 [Trifolium subterraneum]
MVLDLKVRRELPLSLKRRMGLRENKALAGLWGLLRITNLKIFFRGRERCDFKKDMPTLPTFILGLR